MKIQKCKCAKSWNDKITSCIDSSIFHTYEWGKLMEVFENVEFCNVEVEDMCFIPLYKQNEKYYASIIGYGGPCTREHCDFDYAQIIDIIQNKMGITISRANLGPSINKTKLYSNEQSRWYTRLTQIVELNSTYSDFWNLIDGKARTGVRYAEKHNVKVKQVCDKEFKTLYSMYLESIKSIETSYIYPYEFFIELKKNLNENSLYLGAYIDDILIGCNIYVFDDNGIYYLMSIQNDLGKKMQASYILICKAVKFAIGRGNTYFDLGYSHNENIKKFKARWKATDEETYMLM